MGQNKKAVHACQIATLLDITCHWSISLIGMNIIRLHDNQSEMCFCLKLLNGTLCSFDSKVTGLIYVISYGQHDNG